MRPGRLSLMHPMQLMHPLHPLLPARALLWAWFELACADRSAVSAAARCPRSRGWVLCAAGPDAGGWR